MTIFVPCAPAETLPTLDIGRFSAGAADRAAFLEALRSAALGPGFFHLTGHGIPADLIHKVRDVSRAFFALPEEEKLSIAMVNSPHFRGYNRAGLDHTRGKPDWREQIDIGAEEEAVPPPPGAPPWARLRGPNQGPAALPQLRPVLLAYQARVTALAVRALRAFAAALEQPESIFEPTYTPAPNRLLKIIRYPGRSDGDRQGVGAHKDPGFVTVPLQDEGAGLQVEGERGWIDAPPLEGTFVVNIGEIEAMRAGGASSALVYWRGEYDRIGWTEAEIACATGSRG